MPSKPRPVCRVSVGWRKRLGAALRVSRQLAGLTQQQLAWRIGVIRYTVYSVEKGLTAPSVETLLLWSLATRCGVASILTGVL